MAFRSPVIVGTTTDFEQLQAGDFIDLPLLPSNLTIYVDENGNDTTGDGSSGSPYATIARASEDYVLINPGNNELHIDLGVGTITQSTVFTVAYPYGGRLFWDGKFEDVATPTISNIDASASTDGSYPELEYVDFDLDLSSASNVAAGQYVRVVGCTGGTNPAGLNGLHKIVGFSAGTATCRVWRKLNTTELPSGAITVSTVRIIETVINFTANDHGMEMAGPIDLGHWDAVVIEGNATAYGSSKRGLRLFNGAQIRAASESGYSTGLYLAEWGVGIESVGNSTAYILRGGISQMRTTGILAGEVGVSLLRFQSTINGCGGGAIAGTNDAVISADTILIHSCSGGSAFVSASTKAFANVSNGSLSFDQGSGFGAAAEDGGFVQAEGATLTGFTTDYFPEADTFGRGGAYINVNGTDFTYPHDNIPVGYGAGTNYTITTTPAEVDRGTTDSAVVLDEAGTYRLDASVTMLYNGATFAANQTLTVKLRRTNNTAADVTNAIRTVTLEIVTTFTGAIVVVLPTVTYATANANDRIALFVSVGTGPSAGSVQISADNIFAERIA